MTATVESAPGAAPRTRLEIVVGIDPGTRNLGYGAIVVGARGPRLLAAGVVRARQEDVPARLGQIRTELDLLFQRLKPTVIVIEQAFAARNVQSALRIGEGRGVVLGCAAATGARVVQYAPAVAKKALVGHGAADKSQVARMVEHLLGPQTKGLPLDASDALGLALAFCARSRVTAERAGTRPAAARTSPPRPVATARSQAELDRGIVRGARPAARSGAGNRPAPRTETSLARAALARPQSGRKRP